MKTTAIWILKVLLGLMGLTLFYNGAMWAFLPEANLASNQIFTESVLGMNMLKSDIGAPLMAVGLFQALVVFGKKQFVLPVIIISLSYFLVRLVSLGVDGSHPMIITGVVMELLVPILNVLLVRLEGK